MISAFRRGACPALSAPMETGDGLLVRLALTGQALAPDQLPALCAVATQHGNGMVEITARGNFQIRGLTPLSAPLLADNIIAMKLNLRDGVPVETAPLAGLDPDELTDSRPLANAIRVAIDGTDLATRLSPKVSVVVDGGGQFDMADIAADIRLSAILDDDTVHWQIAVGGDAKTATHLGYAENIAEVETATLSLLERIASHGPAARARDLVSADMKRLLSPFTGRGCSQAGGGHSQSAMPTPPLIRPLGDSVSLSDGRFAVPTSLPFGSIHADLLADFVNDASRLGADEIRFAPARRLILLCPSEAEAINVHAAAREAGLVVDADDPRTHIFACPGCPACASGNIPARDIATVVATEWADFINESRNLHISGCAKGCAHPAPSTIALVGNGDQTALVVDGNARNDTLASVPTTKLKPAISRLEKALRAGQNKHDKQRLAAAFAGD